MNFTVSDHGVVLNLKPLMGTESKQRAPNRPVTKSRIITLDSPNASRFDKRPPLYSQDAFFDTERAGGGVAPLLSVGFSPIRCICGIRSLPQEWRQAQILDGWIIASQVWLGSALAGD